MADFQPQVNRFTSGNGTFDLPFLSRIPVTIDPLPHDRGYFEAHLEFVKRYFERESNGAVQISYEVLPAVFRLPHPMAHYSPTGQSDSANYRLAWLARDVWAEVRSSGALDGRTFDSDRTLFIIFHAGVGRDLELTGTTLVKTPQDIPSVYLNPESISRLLGEPYFTGFPVNDLGVAVTETAILPQTNSRPGKDVTGAEYVLELSINGHSAAMMGNFMGLPDLYNTDSGASGIGRFGLMDGAGFFAYNGLFPPSLSAWEKLRLGWAVPFDITLDDTAPVALPLGAIARHRPTLNETILIENRHRDPSGNGITLTIRTPSAAIETVTIPRSEARFSPFDFRKINEILPAGTLIDVSHPDWALPGGPDIGLDGIENTADDRFLAGGILIWRINESVVRDGLVSNRINADPDRRGIELVEADGARDIGRPSGSLTSYDQGAPFDFWWSGNNFTVITASGRRLTVYQNRWAHDTQPSTRGRSGARADFEFYGFSGNQPDGFFRARRVVTTAATSAMPIRLTGSSPFFQSSFQYRDGYPLFITSVADRILVPTPTGFHLADSSAGASVFQEGNAAANQHQPLVSGNQVVSAPQGAVAGPTRSHTVQLDGSLIPDWSTFPGGTIGYLQLRNGLVLAPHTPHRHRLADGGYELVAQPGQVSDDGSVVLRADGLYAISGSRIAELDCPTTFNRLHLHTFRNSGPDPDPAHWVLCQNRIIRIAGTNVATIAEEPSIDFPQFASFGPADETVLYVDRQSGRLLARNATGAMRNGFPIQPKAGFRFIGTPLIWDADGDGRDDIILPADDGHDLVMTGWTSDGQPLAPFPLQIGAAPAGPALPILPHVRNGVLTALSADGELRQWHLPSAAASTVTAVRASTHRTMGSAAPAGLLVHNETYNWPNPATNSTHIRFQTQTAATISIVVVTMDGRTVWSEQLTSESDMPQERLIDTTGWASGVYFARIRATQNGRSEQKLVKIAVAR